MTVLFIIMLIIYMAFLELSKNTLVGWLITAAVAAAFFATGIYLKGKEQWNWKTACACMAGAMLLLVINLKLTGPPFRQMPAVATKNPEITDVIHIGQGDLTGVYNEDKTARVYAGIPYARPPVGALRWREPEAPEAWEGVRACDTFAPGAMQSRSPVWFDSLTKLLGYHNYRIGTKDYYREPVSEDCLYLNVFTPAETGDAPLPVLFFIHGGSLMTGRSSHTEYRGENLAAQGIIVVNFAYRLGVFGYYASEELMNESPNGTTGNYGLLDQIMALRWVRENIAVFGGDPERITIAGESAGASSVNALCVSPLTEGMFIRAIAESSGIVAKKPYHTFRSMDEALEMGADIMAEMGASDIAAMRDIPAEQLVQTSYMNSAMTLDGYCITEMPYRTYEKGQNHEQALLNGFNAKEADAFMLDTKITAENYEEILSGVLGDEAGEAAALVPPGSRIQDEKFITDKGGDAKGSANFVYSAAWFTWSHELWSSYMAAEDRPVYEYYFSKRNPSLSNYHAGEMPYAYGNLWRHAWLYDESDEELSRIMQSYWVNFVKTGDPNADGLPVWEQRDRMNQKVIELGDEIRMTEDPFGVIYPLLERYQETLAAETQ
ncbi:MAG: carboxylesterase family protein [Butyrivibrio sp.]|nr:carboxylesterase family protein [Butyrivibrio sp.]